MSAFYDIINWVLSGAFICMFIMGTSNSIPRLDRFLFYFMLPLLIISTLIFIIYNLRILGLPIFYFVLIISVVLVIIRLVIIFFRMKSRQD